MRPSERVGFWVGLALFTAVPLLAWVIWGRWGFVVVFFVVTTYRIWVWEPRRAKRRREALRRQFGIDEEDPNEAE